MGANLTNTVCENLSATLEVLTGARPGLRILTNLCLRRVARASFRLPLSALDWKGTHGALVAQRLLEAHAFARADVARAVTNNKGLMNGADAVALAAGQDWRALEAAAHAAAVVRGRYGPLAHYHLEEDGDELEGRDGCDQRAGDNSNNNEAGDIEMELKTKIKTKGCSRDRGVLVGELELPVAVGTVGGAVAKNPAARLALRVMGVSGARELAQVVVAAGLANNFAALRALAVEGIQKGHMALHMRGIGGAGWERVGCKVVTESEMPDEMAGQLMNEMRYRECDNEKLGGISCDEKSMVAKVGAFYGIVFIALNRLLWLFLSVF